MLCVEVNSSPLLIFVIDATEARIDSSLSLKDVIGTGRRLDVICRDLVAAFWWGNRLQLHVNAYVTFKLQPSLEVVGNQLLESLVPRTELGFARMLKEIYVNGTNVPGFHLINKRIGEIIQDLLDKGVQIWWLEEGGQDIHSVSLPRDSDHVFILGDHQGVSDEFICQFGKTLPRLSLNPKSYLGSTCVQLILGRQSF